MNTEQSLKEELRWHYYYYYGITYKYIKCLWGNINVWFHVFK